MSSSTPPPQDRPPMQSRPFGTPKSARPYLATLFVIAALGMLPSAGVQWHAVSIDSGMYSRIASAMQQIACLTAAIGAVYRVDMTVEGAVVTADRNLTLRRQLRLVPWGLCAIGYLTMASLAGLVLLADVHGLQIAFRALTLYLIASHAVWFAPPVRHLIRHAPAAIKLLLVGAPIGLLVGGMNTRGYWIDAPWFWTSAALTVLMALRASRARAGTWIRARRGHRADRMKSNQMGT